jgi:hypothetical protein
VATLPVLFLLQSGATGLRVCAWRVCRASPEATVQKEHSCNWRCHTRGCNMWLHWRETSSRRRSSSCRRTASSVCAARVLRGLSHGSSSVRDCAIGAGARV